jgi:hypothetical protein
MMFDYAISLYKINKSFVKNESVPTASLVETRSLAYEFVFFFHFYFGCMRFKDWRGPCI